MTSFSPSSHHTRDKRRCRIWTQLGRFLLASCSDDQPIGDPIFQDSSRQVLLSQKL